MIVAKNLSVIYPDGTLALQDISLTLNDHESVALIGCNGAGKTTFFHAILGLVEISAGSIEVDNLRVEPKNYREIRNRVGFVFQNPDDQLFMPTIRDDIRFGLLQHGMSPAQADAETDEISEKLNITGIQFKPSFKVSGGEKRLAALAAVLVMNPAMVLFDEPSSFLDPRARRNVISILDLLSATKIIATHDLDLAWDLCQRTIIFSDGKLAADGFTKELLSDQKELEKHGLELPLKLQNK
mgnify:CR=1 FL=1|jgi:cobalt/nickel transport system ATP-binding protein